MSDEKSRGNPIWVTILVALIAAGGSVLATWIATKNKDQSVPRVSVPAEKGAESQGKTGPDPPKVRNDNPVDKAQKTHLKPLRSPMQKFTVAPPTVAPPTQNCPNGNCIGGDNYGTASVNNYGPPRRQLSADQKIKIVATLKPFCPFDVAVRPVAGHEDSMEYADQLKDAIAAAGCNIVRARFLIDTGSSHGVFVAVHDAESVPKGTDAVYSALIAAGIPTKGMILDALEPGKIYVMVSPAEEQQKP